jgi:hypothetical protein
MGQHVGGCVGGWEDEWMSGRIDRQAGRQVDSQSQYVSQLFTLSLKRR